MAHVTTTESRLPLIVRLVNQSGEILNRLHIRSVNLSRERLMATARKQTGLSDWGEDDFLTPLTVLLDAYEKEADLSLLGRVIVQKTLERLLANRLLIQRDFTNHPEILQQPVDKPLFIIGLPRTGTTLLFNLLAQHPGARTPLFWELFLPSPPPEEATRQTDPRIAVADESIYESYISADALHARDDPDVAGRMPVHFSICLFHHFLRDHAQRTDISPLAHAAGYGASIPVLSVRFTALAMAYAWCALDAEIAASSFFSGRVALGVSRRLYYLHPSRCGKDRRFFMQLDCHVAPGEQPQRRSQSYRFVSTRYSGDGC